jgi:hypothetical protein
VTIRIQTHGGRCCGIKTIHGFGGHPNDYVGAKKKQPRHQYTDIYGHSVSKNYNFYRDARPKETYLERFKAYLEYLKEERPSGLVEVTMTGCQLDYRGWQKVLEDHGFKEVTKFYNSNSGDHVYVFHLVYGPQAPEYDDDDYCDDDYYEGED